MTEPGMAELAHAVPEYRLSLFQGKFVAVPEYFTRWDGVLCWFGNRVCPVGIEFGCVVLCFVYVVG